MPKTPRIPPRRFAASRSWRSRGAVAGRRGAVAGVRHRQRLAHEAASRRLTRRMSWRGRAGRSRVRRAAADRPSSALGAASRHADGRRRRGRNDGGRPRCWCGGSRGGPGRRGASPRCAPERSCSRRRAARRAAASRRIGGTVPSWRAAIRRCGWSRPDLRARRRVWTSAGVTAGIDLALAFVEADSAGPRRWRWRAISWCSQASGRAGAVQRGAVALAAEPEFDALHDWMSRQPAAGPLGAATGRPRRHERAQLRPALSCGDRRHAVACRGAAAGGGGARGVVGSRGAGEGR